MSAHRDAVPDGQHRLPGVEDEMPARTNALPGGPHPLLAADTGMSLGAAAGGRIAPCGGASGR